MPSEREKALIRDAAARADMARKPVREGRGAQPRWTPHHRAPEVPLSVKELEVLCLMADGFHDAEIAERLCKGVETVKTQMRRILAHLEARNRAHAAVIALRRGLID